MSKARVTVRSGFKDVLAFGKLISVRKGIIAQAAEAVPVKDFAVNKTARALHPEVQHMTVSRVVSVAPGVKSYVLTPDASLGTTQCAYFRAGQYLSVRVSINGAIVTRPYSISSSPARALDGEYIITVKRIQDGFVSGYILDKWRPGTKVDVSAPEGNFCYEPLRDAKTIVGVAGGSGITPFLSLAQAIADGTENARLVLLYGCRSRKDALFSDLLDELQESCDKIHVVYVFSDEKVADAERGFVTRKIIEKYSPEKFSLFVCGPAALYKFIAGETADMGIEQKYIRYEMFGEIKNPTALRGFPTEALGKSITCTLMHRGETLASITCSCEESLLTSLERSGIEIPSGCRSGECGLCRARLFSGSVFIPREADKRRLADARYGYIHPCMAYPTKDITLII
ncbi:MAG: 2Fe-2S iron-sulfur cluster binding domain-containing protein [Clostridiales bacterium]|nr:2Fe-2S iron-sulfur cluster binding domain-containing protein [Clostridiales bacterium]